MFGVKALVLLLCNERVLLKTLTSVLFYDLHCESTLWYFCSMLFATHNAGYRLKFTINATCDFNFQTNLTGNDAIKLHRKLNHSISIRCNGKTPRAKFKDI